MIELAIPVVSVFIAGSALWFKFFSSLNSLRQELQEKIESERQERRNSMKELHAKIDVISDSLKVLGQLELHIQYMKEKIDAIASR